MSSVRHTEPTLGIVAIGASTVGQQALRSLIGGLKPNGNTTYVVAHHLSPNHLNIPAELPRASSALTVATDGELLQPDCVYVA